MSKAMSTAMAMTKVLANGKKVYAADFRKRIKAEGGDPAYVNLAAKRLRDFGVQIVAHKARHQSYWQIIPNTSIKGSATSDEWVRRVRREHYSEAVSTARALSQSKDPLVLLVRDTVRESAIALGRQMGMTLDAVVADCEVLKK